jgi:serine phosphatase RsbU (regulator of sigma subunit)
MATLEEGGLFARFDSSDRRAIVVGAFVLLVVAVVYPFVADATARPLAAFVLPCLLTAVLGGWRPTLLVGITSFSVAVVIGLLGPLDIEALLARWLIIGVGVLMGAVGAAVRQRQSGRLADLNETMTLRAAFERALAPAPITPDGYVAAARYRPAESRLKLGGDFLEALALEDGRLAVLIGDVCGHGPREAAFGAALRAGWKAIALSGKHDPADWVDALDASFFRDGRIDTYVTLCTGYLDVTAGVARLVNVGHPPPVLLERRARMLALPPTPPLGLGLNDSWTAVEVPWAGQPMLLYTDGLVENPSRQGKPRRWGEQGLLAWLDARPHTTTLADLADRLVQSATAGRTIRDDIAVLIVAGDE